MTIEPKALGAASFSTSDLCHCPLCGCELRSGTDNNAYECPGCEYTEREVAA